MVKIMRNVGGKRIKMVKIMQNVGGKKMKTVNVMRNVSGKKWLKNISSSGQNISAVRGFQIIVE